MELLVVVLLAIIAWGVWNIARTHRAAVLQREADSNQAIAAAAVAVQSFTGDGHISAQAPATAPAAMDTAQAAVAAAEFAASQARASVGHMRELLAKGCPRGIAWTEWGDKDPSRDLAKEAEDANEQAGAAARDAQRLLAVGSAHSRVLGEIAIHVHRSARAALLANSTAYDAVEHDDKDRDLLHRERAVYEAAWKAAFRAQVHFRRREARRTRSSTRVTASHERYPT